MGRGVTDIFAVQVKANLINDNKIDSVLPYAVSRPGSAGQDSWLNRHMNRIWLFDESYLVIDES